MRVLLKFFSLLKQVKKNNLKHSFLYSVNSVFPSCFFSGFVHHRQSASNSFFAIQKNVSLLQNTRTQRRKKFLDDEFSIFKEHLTTSAYATAEEYNLEELCEFFRLHQGFVIKKLPQDAQDVVQIVSWTERKEPTSLPYNAKTFFLFREGSIVFWNFSTAEKIRILNLIKNFQVGSYDQKLILEQMESINYSFIEGKSGLFNGEFLFQKHDAEGLFTNQKDQNNLRAHENLNKINNSSYTSRNNICDTIYETQEGNDLSMKEIKEPIPFFIDSLEMFAFSNAISLSVKLAVWEASLDSYALSIGPLIENMKNGRSLKLSERDVMKMSGELYTLSHLINLGSDLLDPPDFYWDRSQLERIYQKTCLFFNISRRTKIMNEKLKQCIEFTELVRDHLKDKHHTRLELMIIFLILIEVIYGSVHFIDKFCFEESTKILIKK